MTMPRTLHAGINATWRQESPVYNAGYSLSVHFVNAQGAFSVSSGVLNGDGYDIEVAASVTAGWPPGNYKWRAVASMGAAKHVVADGEVTIEPDFSTASRHDARTHNEKVRDALAAVIENRATSDQLKVSISGKSLERMPLGDLIVQHKKYCQYVAQEQVAKRLGGRGEFGQIRKIGVRFDRS